MERDRQVARIFSNSLGRDTAEKGNFLFAHAGKIQFIGIGQLGDLRQVKSCQTDTDTDQDGLGGLSSNKMSIVF